MTSKKIIAFRGDRAACWFYRLHSPLTYLAKNNQDAYEITVSGVLNKAHYEGFDLAILQRQYAKDVYDGVLNLKKSGTKLVYEIDDDLFNIPKWNPAYETLGKANVQLGIREFLKIVDAIFVTTESLKKIYEPFCDNIYVLPNSINYDVIYPNAKKNQKKDVVCWQGSLTHEKDVKIIEKSLHKLAQSDEAVLKMWCGFKQRKTLKEDRTPVFDIPGADVLQLVQFESFFQMFSQVGTSIGLAPLAANTFNKSKSNLKFLEYTALDAVTVASSVGPYKDTIEDGVTGILVEDNSTWYDVIIDLIRDKELYNKLLTNAKEVVHTEYNVERNYKMWQDAIEQILG